MSTERAHTQSGTSPPTEIDCDIYTPETLAELWDISAAQIREACRLKRLPARKCGPRKWIIGKAALAAWLADGGSPTTSPAPAPERHFRGIVVRKP